MYGDFSNLIHHRVGERPLRHWPRRRDLCLILAGELAHVTWALTIPLLLHPWWAVAAFYLVCSWVVGFTLAMIFQLAHCVDSAQFAGPDEPGRGDDFELHQLRTTVDVDCRVSLLRWMMGGLDRQIEHHLAPRLPHTIYALVAQRLRELCADRHIIYRLHPNVPGAVRAHARLAQADGPAANRQPQNDGRGSRCAGEESRNSSGRSPRRCVFSHGELRCDQDIQNVTDGAFSGARFS
jgi:linoleoyl-CoA desaturase